MRCGRCAPGESPPTESRHVSCLRPGSDAPSPGNLVDRRGERSSHVEGGKSLPRCQEVGPAVPRAPGPTSFPISPCPSLDGQSRSQGSVFAKCVGASSFPGGEGAPAGGGVRPCTGQTALRGGPGALDASSSGATTLPAGGGLGGQAALLGGPGTRQHWVPLVGLTGNLGDRLQLPRMEGHPASGTRSGQRRALCGPRPESSVSALTCGLGRGPLWPVDTLTGLH